MGNNREGFAHSLWSHHQINRLCEPMFKYSFALSSSLSNVVADKLNNYNRESRFLIPVERNLRFVVVSTLQRLKDARRCSAAI